MIENYILNAAGEPELCHDLMTWARWYANHENRRLAQTTLADGTWISTVFLAMDHHLCGGPHVPVLWETLVSGGEFDDYCERYVSRLQALAGHERIVHAVQIGKDPGEHY